MERLCRIRWRFILLILAGCCCFTLTADGSELLPRDSIYTLNDLYRIASERSEQIKISAEDLFIAEQYRVMALAVLVPSVNGFGSYTRYHENKSYGGSIIQPAWNFATGIKVGQAITLNGRELTAFRMAEQNIAAAQKDLYNVREAYLYSVAAAYYEVLKRRRWVEIAGANMERLSRHLGAVKARLEVEDVTKTALYRTQAELSQSKTDLIQQENALKLAKTILSRVVGIEGYYDIRGPGLSRLLLQEDLDSLTNQALENRSDLLALIERREIARQQVNYVRGAYWPTLAAEGGVLYQDQQDAPDVGKESFYISLNLNVPIYDGGLKQARAAEAQSQRRQAELAVENFQQQIKVEVEQVYLEVMTYQSVLTSLDDKLHFARENYNAVIRQFQHGLATSVDVMDANTLLVTTQQALSESEYSYRLALLTLEKVKGTFLASLADILK